MKKSYLFGLLAALLSLSACNTEDEIANESTAQKGMILHATVAQSPDTRATINNETRNWTFAFTDGDQVIVKNGECSTGYTFTKDGDSFKSTDAQPTSETSDWSAYYPSQEVNITNQSGSIADVAKHWALFGETNTTGENGLDITMKPTSTILKIINNKGAVDIAYKDTNSSQWIVSFAGNNNGTTCTGSDARQSIFTTSETGTFYIVVPAKFHLLIYDGDELLTCDTTFDPGKYYTLTINPPIEPIVDDNLVNGVFSVSRTKAVQFTKGNLYWNGSEFKLESSQLDHPTDWDEEHVGHFVWTTMDDYKSGYSKPYDEYTASSTSDNDKLWCCEDNPLTIDSTSGLYVLTKDEWSQIIENRVNAENLRKIATINGTVCLILAPDHFTGTIADSYNTDEWSIAEAKGFVCLPRAGVKEYDEIENGDDVDNIYATATGQKRGSQARGWCIDSYIPEIVVVDREKGHSIRLVKTVK